MHGLTRRGSVVVGQQFRRLVAWAILVFTSAIYALEPHILIALLWMFGWPQMKRHKTSSLAFGGLEDMRISVHTKSSKPQNIDKFPDSVNGKLCRVFTRTRFLFL